MSTPVRTLHSVFIRCYTSLDVDDTDDTLAAVYREALKIDDWASRAAWATTDVEWISIVVVLQLQT